MGCPWAAFSGSFGGSLQRDRRARQAFVYDGFNAGDPFAQVSNLSRGLGKLGARLKRKGGVKGDDC